MLLKITWCCIVFVYWMASVFSGYWHNSVQQQPLLSFCSAGVVGMILIGRLFHSTNGSQKSLKRLRYVWPFGGGEVYGKLILVLVICGTRQGDPWASWFEWHLWCCQTINGSMYHHSLHWKSAMWTPSNAIGWAFCLLGCAAIHPPAELIWPWMSPRLTLLN